MSSKAEALKMRDRLPRGNATLFLGLPRHKRSIERNKQGLEPLEAYFKWNRKNSSSSSESETDWEEDLKEELAKRKKIRLEAKQSRIAARKLARKKAAAQRAARTKPLTTSTVAAPPASVAPHASTVKPRTSREPLSDPAQLQTTISPPITDATQPSIAVAPLSAVRPPQATVEPTAAVVPPAGPPVTAMPYPPAPYPSQYARELDRSLLFSSFRPDPLLAPFHVPYAPPHLPTVGNALGIMPLSFTQGTERTMPLPPLPPPPPQPSSVLDYILAEKFPLKHSNQENVSVSHLAASVDRSTVIPSSAITMTSSSISVASHPTPSAYSELNVRSKSTLEEDEVHRSSPQPASALNFILGETFPRHYRDRIRQCNASETSGSKFNVLSDSDSSFLQESLVHEVAPPESSEEIILQEPIPRESTHQASGSRDLIQPDLSPQGLTPQVSSPQGASAQDLSPQDLSPQDLSPQDLSPQDLDPQDLSPQDLDPQDLSPDNFSSDEKTQQNTRKSTARKLSSKKTPAPRKSISQKAPASRKIASKKSLPQVGTPPVVPRDFQPTTVSPGGRKYQCVDVRKRTTHTPGVRRSQRNRVATVNSWEGAVVDYGQWNPEGQEVRRVLVPVREEREARKRPRPVVRDDDYPEVEFIDDNGETVTTERVVFTYESASVLPAGGNGTCDVHSYWKTHSSSMGMLTIAPGGSKKKSKPRGPLCLFRIKGRVSVTVNKIIYDILAGRTVVKIPAGVGYSIKNMSKTQEAQLYYYSLEVE